MSNGEKWLINPEEKADKNQKNKWTKRVIYPYTGRYNNSNTKLYTKCIEKAIFTSCKGIRNPKFTVKKWKTRF